LTAPTTSNGGPTLLIYIEVKVFTKDEDKVAKWENRQDQACGLIGISISLDLRFHIVELDTPDEAMK